MSKKSISLLVVLLMLAVLPVAAMANAATMYVVTNSGSSVRLRSEMDTGNRNNIICDVAYGTTVDVTGYSGSWAHVMLADGTRGYMMSRYLSVDAPRAKGSSSSSNNNNNNSSSDVQLPDFSKFKKVEPYDVIVRPAKPNGFVNFRWAPSMDCKVAMRCYADYPLQVIAQDNHWAQVVDSQTGYVGFMYRKFLTTVDNDAQIGNGVVVNP